MKVWRSKLFEIICFEWRWGSAYLFGQAPKTGWPWHWPCNETGFWNWIFHFSQVLCQGHNIRNWFQMQNQTCLWQPPSTTSSPPNLKPLAASIATFLQGCHRRRKACVCCAGPLVIGTCETSTKYTWTVAWLWYFHRFFMLNPDLFRTTFGTFPDFWG